MKLAAVSIVRDEADILEAWIRHNLHFIDRLYIVDDGSTDNSLRIIHALRDEGLAISLTSERSLAAYHQGQRTTALVEHALSEAPWDYIFFLDGDEFLVAHDRATLEADLSLLGTSGVGGLNPRHYLLSDADDPQGAPLQRLTRVAVHEPYVFKVVVPGALASERGFSVRDGNHRATKWNVPLRATLLPNVELAHFPARSEAKLVSKGIAGYLRWSARTDFGNGKAPDRLMEGVSILKEESDLKIQRLSRLAEALGADRGAQNARYQPFVELRGEVRFPELARTFPYRRMISATDDLIHAYKATLQENAELRQKSETLFAAVRGSVRRLLRSARRRLVALRTGQLFTEIPRGY